MYRCVSTLETNNDSDDDGRRGKMNCLDRSYNLCIQFRLNSLTDLDNIVVFGKIRFVYRNVISISSVRKSQCFGVLFCAMLYNNNRCASKYKITMHTMCTICYVRSSVILHEHAEISWKTRRKYKFDEYAKYTDE